MDPKKIIVTGSNGFIGANFVQLLLSNTAYNVIGLSKGKSRLDASSSNYQYFSVNLENHTLVNNIIQSQKPTAIVHCAAISQVDYCEKFPEKCHSINVNATQNLANIANAMGIHFVFISSDFVFNGAKFFCDEEDSTHPISAYGNSKRQAEEYILKTNKNFAIIRPVLVYGFSASARRGNIFTWVVENVESKTPIKVVNDQIRTPTFVNDLSNLMYQVLKKNAQGIFHIGGGNQVSVFHFAKQIAGNWADYISAVKSNELKGALLRPKNSCFSSRKIKREFGINPVNTKTGVSYALKQLGGHI